MKRNLNKDEEEAAFRRKNAKDPNPDRKGKAINVKTEATYPQDFKNPDGSKRNVAKKKTVDLTLKVIMVRKTSMKGVITGIPILTKIVS